jgi:hypothetical protein
MQGRASRLLDEMANNPRGDWTINDIQRVCRDNGLTCVPPTGGGSHFKVSSPNIDEILTIPARRPIKPIYIKLFVGFVRKSEERN